MKARQPLRSTLLYELTADLGEMQFVGDTPAGKRIIGPVTGGTFEGPRLRGKILPGGADWVMVRKDGVRELDVRFTLQTDDEALIFCEYPGYLHGPPAVMREAFTKGTADPNDYYIRGMMRYETGAEQYDWLNRIIAVGVGQLLPNARIGYSVFEIL